MQKLEENYATGLGKNILGKLNGPEVRISLVHSSNNKKAYAVGVL